MLYTVIAVLITLFALGAWLAPPRHSPAQVERGQYLVEVLGACGNCHTPRDEHGEIDAKHLAGGLEIRESFGVAVAPNITPDRETGLGRWSDAEIVRAIREGRSRDGRVLGPPMPFHLYRRLSDRDVQAVVRYLRTIPPVRNAVGPSRYTVPLPATYGPPVGRVGEPDRSNLVAYGEYLAGPVAHCMDCHTPRGAGGRADAGRLVAEAWRSGGRGAPATRRTSLRTRRPGSAGSTTASSSPPCTAPGATGSACYRRCRRPTTPAGSPRPTSERSSPTCAH